MSPDAARILGTETARLSAKVEALPATPKGHRWAKGLEDAGENFFMSQCAADFGATWVRDNGGAYVVTHRSGLAFTYTFLRLRDAAATVPKLVRIHRKRADRAR